MLVNVINCPRVYCTTVIVVHCPLVYCITINVINCPRVYCTIVKWEVKCLSTNSFETIDCRNVYHSQHWRPSFLNMQRMVLQLSVKLRKYGMSFTLVFWLNGRNLLWTFLKFVICSLLWRFKIMAFETRCITLKGYIRYILSDVLCDYIKVLISLMLMLY